MGTFTAVPGLDELVAQMVAPEVRNVAERVELEAKKGAPAVKRWACVAPETIVAASGVTHAARRHYEGTLVRVTTATGRVIAVTPEHDVLTGHGWLPAHTLDLSDHLVRVVRADAAGAPHVENVPASIGEVIDAAMDSGRLSVQMRSMFHGVDLNSDAPLDSQVEVVDADRELVLRLKSGVPEGSEQMFLTTADTLGHVSMLPGRLGRAPRLPVSAALECHGHTCGPRCLLFGRLERGPQLSRAALVAELDTSICEDADDCLGAAPKQSSDLPGRLTCHVGGCQCRRVNVVAAGDHVRRPAGFQELLFGLRSLAVPAGSIRGGQQLTAVAESSPDGLSGRGQCGSQFLQGFPGSVAADQIVHIEHVPYSGHVYDLSTAGGWYLASDTVVHNSMGDGRVRPTHVHAHGQEVPENLRFEVQSMDWDRRHRGVGPITYMMKPKDESSRAVANLKNCRCVSALLPTAIAEQVKVGPTRVYGTEIRITVSCTAYKIVECEFGDYYPDGNHSPGTRFMGKAAQRAAASMR